ncbi:MAG TPA: undecaprenyl-diphosphate phosphatase [Bacillota bacterium]|nr:undecaprenyl-diphosphate phosphatase [Bacillota bacterium]
MDHLTALCQLLTYVFLGLFQGVTEPLPISSSGHLIILRELFDIRIKGLSFEILVNFGSLIAVFLVYRNAIVKLMINGLYFIQTKEQNVKRDGRFILLLIVATIPTGLIGLILKDYISQALSGVRIVGATLLLTGLALWIIRNLRGWKNDEHITIKDAIIVGLAQSVALVPGISRSGATLVAAMLVGMKRETALRFSFLLYIPVSLGITVLSVGDMIGADHFSTFMIPYLLAFMAAIIASFYALRWFINIMKRGNLKYFAIYCFIAGAAVLLSL